MMKKYIVGIITMMMLLPIVTSCHDDLDTEPLSNLSPENFISNIENSEVAVNGVYSQMALVYGQNFIYMSDHGTHVATTSVGNPKLNAYAFYTFDSNSLFLKDTWAHSYKAIARANFVIDRVGELETEDPAKNRIIAEAKFLRALCYFNLVRFYGDVPLILEELTDFKTLNTDNVDSADVYAAIVEDLKFGEEHLFYASWLSKDKPSYEGGNLGRATIGAAKGLLAKVYLTMASHPLQIEGAYQLAYDKAKEIYDSKDYQLDNYTDICTIEGESSTEWLFQVQFDVAGLQPSQWGALHNPLNQGKGGKEANDFGWGRVAPTVKFTKQYEDGDLRFDHNIAKGKINADGSIKYNKDSKRWYTHKYRFSVKPLDRFKTDMNAPVLRYADILLILAEAGVEVGKTEDAFNALDEVLVRAQNMGGGTVPALVDRALTGEPLDDFIFWERARELCFEGHAKFDLVRAGRERFVEEVLDQEWTKNETKASETKIVPWASNVNANTPLLFPIPAAEGAGAL